MGGPTLIKFRNYFFQFLKAGNVLRHIPVTAEHENPAMFLNGISADEHPMLKVQDRYAAGRMPGKINDPPDALQKTTGGKRVCQIM